MSKPIPEGFTSVTPVFVFKDCRKAIDFYQQAFGAQELFVMPGPEGKGVMHAEIKIGNSILMLGDEHPQMSCQSVETFGGPSICTCMLRTWTRPSEGHWKPAPSH